MLKNTIRKEPERFLIDPDFLPNSKNLNSQPVSDWVAWTAIMVAALGYFVDVFDMWLFTNFRVQSLKELGYYQQGITNYGALLINSQQAGFLIGGFVWGMLGDKRGRSSVMFASILLYSIGNILNSYVTNIEQYVVLRFITGFGLAGEIGAGITLVCELLPTKKRGIGTTIVATVGVAGAIGAALAGKYLDWRNAFFIGGLMGLSLLVLRLVIHESGMFSSMKEDGDIKKGSLKLLFSSRDRIFRYLSCLSIGIPIYLSFGVFTAFAPEIASAIGMTIIPTVPDVMLFSSIGITLGDLVAGYISQKLKSRKKPLVGFIILTAIICFSLTSGLITDYDVFLWSYGFLGLFAGYWACLITTSAEQFGTNLRATVTTTIPNLIRASTIILVSSFIWLKELYSVQSALYILTTGTFIVAGLGVFYLKESFHTDLDFYEK